MIAKVNTLTKEITFTAGKYPNASGDDLVQKLDFVLDRYTGNGVDLGESDIYIYYTNGRGDTYSHPIINRVNTDDGLYVAFTWHFAREVSEYKGNTKFSVCAKIIDGETITNEWNSEEAVLPTIKSIGSRDVKDLDSGSYEEFEAAFAKLKTDVSDELSDFLIESNTKFQEFTDEMNQTMSDFSDQMDEKVSDADEFSNVSERYAKGTEDGTAVTSGDGYQDNSLFYARRSERYAKGTEDGTAVSSGVGYHDNALYYNHNAERYAKGTEDGEDVTSGVGYHDNAKYWKEQVEASAHQITQNQVDIAAQTARIDNIASLPSGTTSADAELIDIRTGADGVTRTNAGTAVRQQIDNLVRVQPNQPTTPITRVWLDSDESTSVEVPTYDEFTELKSAIESNEIATFTGEYAQSLRLTGAVDLSEYSVGEVVDISPINGSGKHYTVLIPGIITGEIFTITSTDSSSYRPWAFLDSGYKLLAVAESYEVDNVELAAPDNASYLLVQVGKPHISNASIKRTYSLQYLQNLDNRMTAMGKGEIDADEMGFVRGSLYLSGLYNPNVAYRVATKNKVVAKSDIHVYVQDGFRYYYYYFDASGTKTYSSGWKTDYTMIPQNSIFTFLIARVTDDASESADVDTFVSALKFAVTFEKQIIDLQNAEIDLTNVYNGDIKLVSSAAVPLGSYNIGDTVDLTPLDTTGSHYTALIHDVYVGDIFYLNITDGTSARPWAFLDKDKKLISMAATADATLTELVAPADAKWLLVQCGSVHYSNAKVVRYSSFSEYDKNIGIVYQNDYADMIEKLENASNSAKNDTSSAVKSRANLLNLIHFSDIHGDVNNIRRIIRFANQYDNYVSDIIHTGDSPATYYGQDNPFAIVGGDKILNVVGNHDCWIQGDTWPHPYNATAQQVYEKFFSPYISSWNVTSAGTNLCYYYKDYSTANVRLIVLDALHYDSAQETWFVNTLASAKTAGLRVIAVDHYAAQTGLTGIDCTFNSITQTINPVADPAEGAQIERLPESAFTAVDAFITDGGEFVCWLSGHTHDDYIGAVTGHSDQLQIIVSTGSTSNKYSDCARTPFTKTQDLFNIFTVDGNAKLIKLIRVGSTVDKFMRKRETLCINYNTKAIISNN